MYFQRKDKLEMLEDATFPSDVTSMTFELWLRPQNDVALTDELKLFRLDSYNSDVPEVIIYMGPNCKCITVEYNKDSSLQFSTPDVSDLSIPAFLGVSLANNGGNLDVGINF